MNLNCKFVVGEGEFLPAIFMDFRVFYFYFYGELKFIYLHTCVCFFCYFYPT